MEPGFDLVIAELEKKLAEAKEVLEFVAASPTSYGYASIKARALLEKWGKG